MRTAPASDSDALPGQQEPAAEDRPESWGDAAESDRDEALRRDVPPHW